MSIQMLKPLVEKRRRDRINRSLEELRLLLLQRTHCQVTTFLGSLSLQTLKKPKVEKAEILEMAVRYLREMNSAKSQGTSGLHGGGEGECVCMHGSGPGLAQPPVQEESWQPAASREGADGHCSPPCLEAACLEKVVGIHGVGMTSLLPGFSQFFTLPGADLSENRTLQTCYMMGFRECLMGLAAFIQQAHPSVQSRLLDTLHLYLEAHPQDWSYAAFSPSPSLEGSPPRTPEAFSSPLKTLNDPLRPNPDPACSSTGPLGSRRRDAHEGTSPTKRMIPPAPAFWRPWP
ncbi:hypothetical protein JD844_000916 [Phrynosoma platyrhinos]|uniref:Hairy and enhancer of split-related protein HELT n=1 Tax=Phrynosoma platyrhinos TaxID=52577 RepID=A0ABQ7T9N6_PHRPL|nr:hypothetical protein JD844_000916 [Phrynosoma platyrhinos]